MPSQREQNVQISNASGLTRTVVANGTSPTTAPTALIRGTSLGSDSLEVDVPLGDQALDHGGRRRLAQGRGRRRRFM